MLQLTRRVDYALIALTHLAGGGAKVSARELAEAYELSQPLIANVLKVLARGGLVESARGTKGGYTLATPADKVTVGRVVELIEGPLRLAECISVPGPAADAAVRDPRPVGQEKDHAGCCLSRTCPVRQSVFRIHLKIRDVLYGMTVAEMARQSRRPGEVLPVTQPVPSESAP